VDELRNLLLDAIELKSEINIIVGRKVFAPFLETRWQHKELLIPYELPHVIDGVVDLPRNVLRLLHAGELRFVAE